MRHLLASLSRDSTDQTSSWNAGGPIRVLSRMGGLSLATIVIAVFFSLVGFAAFRYGKKNGEPRSLFLGIALMAYGYFVSNAWISLGIGAVLTLLLFFPR
jgi:hypothetical protein